MNANHYWSLPYCTIASAAVFITNKVMTENAMTEIYIICIYEHETIRIPKSKNNIGRSKSYAGTDVHRQLTWKLYAYTAVVSCMTLVISKQHPMYMLRASTQNVYIHLTCAYVCSPPTHKHTHTHTHTDAHVRTRTDTHTHTHNKFYAIIVYIIILFELYFLFLGPIHRSTASVLAQ